MVAERIAESLLCARSFDEIKKEAAGFKLTCSHDAAQMGLVAQEALTLTTELNLARTQAARFLARRLGP